MSDRCADRLANPLAIPRPSRLIERPSSDAAAPGRPGPAGQRALKVVAAWLWTLALCACSSLPARQPTPPKAPVSEVEVQGARGPASAHRALRLLGAEGRAAAVRHHLEVLGAVDRGGTLYRGNQTRLLVDGPATFAAMEAAIRQARRRILLESYIVEDEGVAARVSALLVQKAAAGVQVSLIYDAVGSIGTPDTFFKELRAAGVSVCQFNPLNPAHRPGHWGIVQRDHRKLLVVDDVVAYTGGINISRVYGSGSFSGSRGRASEDPLEDGWRDTQIELKGPVVPALATTFKETWADQGCKGRLGPMQTQAVGEPGRRHVMVMATEPDEDDNPIYRSLIAAVDAAQDEVLLTIAYFAPGADFVRALCDAAQRGVQVELVLPGQSDFPLVLHAGRWYYDRLLEAGVRIHERTDAMMHAKTAVIDGVWSTVGSSNLDWRSLVGNRELNVIVLGDDFGDAMRAQFARDREASETIELDAWRDRGLKQRSWELIGRLTERWL